MNDHPSPLSYMDGDRSSSPRRKKIRQKYAPKACVSCRRSKLKCSGENPCQRCVDNGKRCFYSEDQTAAEVLQNLSRPTPPAAPHRPSFSNGSLTNNAHVAPPRAMMPHNDVFEHSPGHVTSGMTMEERMTRMETMMEERMTRIENMMEALAQDRGMVFTPEGRLAREESVGFRSDMAFSMPILDPIHPALDQMTQQSPDPMQHSLLAEGAGGDPDASAFVRAGTQNVPFPDAVKYEGYVAYFFDHVHIRLPCVDEADFSARKERIVTDGAIDPSDIHFLQLCYVAFACCDFMKGEVPPTETDDSDPPGWRWLQVADHIADQESLRHGSNDVTLIQYLLFKAFYLTCADMPSLAYATSLSACNTATLQYNLHQQHTWTETNRNKVYWRICVLWNLCISDRNISLSCGRGPFFDSGDFSVETPQDFYDRSNMLLHDTDGQMRNANLVIHHDMELNKLIAVLLNPVGSTGQGVVASSLPSIILQFNNTTLFDPVPTIATRPQSTTVAISLMLKRRTIVLALGCNLADRYPEILHSLGHVAINTLAGLQGESFKAPSCRHELTSALASILSILSHHVLLDLPAPAANETSPGYSNCVDSFLQALSMLNDLAPSLAYAKRVLRECDTVASAFKHVWEKFLRVGLEDYDFGDVADVVPPLIEERFPFRKWPRLSLQDLEGHGPTEYRDSGAGVLWIH